MVLAQEPALIVTVDNGVSSVEGVAVAKAAGADVIITDHHLPGETLPDAHAHVNPNLAGSRFPSPNLAGVGVAYYVMSVARRALRARGHFKARGIAEPNLAQWLDLVALGTVADVVTAGPGTTASWSTKGCGACAPASAGRGFKPSRKRPAGRSRNCPLPTLALPSGRGLNAAGRLEDMAVGIRCLLAQTDQAARRSAQRLNELNAKRREIEVDMTERRGGPWWRSAKSARTWRFACTSRTGTKAWWASWQGACVNATHRPAIAFRGRGGRGAGRTQGLGAVHTRSEHSRRHRRLRGPPPGAGGQIRWPRRRRRAQPQAPPPSALSAGVQRRPWRREVSERDLAGVIVTDGELAADDLNVRNAHLVARNGPWGQGFPEPTFHGEFDVVNERVVGERHLKISLKHDGRVADAIAFNQAPIGANRARAVYRLGVNDYADVETLQLQVDKIEPC